MVEGTLSRSRIKKKLHTAHVQCIIKDGYCLFHWQIKCMLIGKTKVTVKFLYINDLSNPKTSFD